MLKVGTQSWISLIASGHSYESFVSTHRNATRSSFVNSATVRCSLRRHSYSLR